MAITEKGRRDLFNHLEEALGSDPANNLMELLPTQPADQLVTRTDLLAMSAELRGEMAQLRAHLERLMVGGLVANAIAVITALVA